MLDKQLKQRLELLIQMQKSLNDQPRLQKETQSKITANENAIYKNNEYRTRLLILTDDLHLIIKANFEMNNPIASNPVMHEQCIMVASFYIALCAKYPSEYKLQLFRAMLNSLPESIDFENHTIYEILHSEAFLIDCMKRKIPLCLSFVDNLALLDISQQIFLPCPLIIDPSGTLVRYLKTKHEHSLRTESFSVDSSTIQNIEAAIVSGHVLVLVDFDHELLKLVEPLIEQRYDTMINVIYKKHLFSEEPQEAKQEDEENELLILEQEAQEVTFNGKLLKMNPEFRLILTLRNSRVKLSKLMLEKLFLINNDVSDEGTWKELVGDMIATNCYAREREQCIDKYFNEKLFNDANESFNLLCQKCAQQGLAGSFDTFFVEDMEKLAQELKKNYNIQHVSDPLLSPTLQPSAQMSDHGGVTPESEQITQRELHSAALHEGTPTPLRVPRSQTEYMELNDQPYTPEMQERRRAGSLAGGKYEVSRRSQDREIEEYDSGSPALSNHSGSSRRSFFNYARGRDSVDENSSNSLFLDDKKIPEYCSMLGRFEDIHQLLQKHSALLDQLYINYQALSMLNKAFGELYGLSDYFSLLSLQTALELAVSNGYLKNSSKNDHDKHTDFRVMVQYYYYHQLYSSLREDHQNVFSVFISVVFRQCKPEFPVNIWNQFLKGSYDHCLLQETFDTKESELVWRSVRAAIIGYHHSCEESFPPPLTLIVEKQNLRSSSAESQPKPAEIERTIVHKKSRFSQEHSNGTSPRSGSKHVTAGEFTGGVNTSGLSRFVRSQVASATSIQANTGGSYSGSRIGSLADAFSFRSSKFSFKKALVSHLVPQKKSSALMERRGLQKPRNVDVHHLNILQPEDKTCKSLFMLLTNCSFTSVTLITRVWHRVLGHPKTICFTVKPSARTSLVSRLSSLVSRLSSL